jgi:hypothetical protein
MVRRPVHHIDGTCARIQRESAGQAAPTLAGQGPRMWCRDPTADRTHLSCPPVCGYRHYTGSNLPAVTQRRLIRQTCRHAGSMIIFVQFCMLTSRCTMHMWRK